jgi:AraC-like DNA-binding protein
MVPHLEQGSLPAYTPPRKGPSADISSLIQLDRSLTIRGFAIKYVVQGTERYQLNGVNHAVRAGEYVLANHHCNMHVHIDSRMPVKGLCMELTRELMDQVAHAWLYPNDLEGRDGASFFTDATFPEARYGRSGTRLGPLLHQLSQALFAAPGPQRILPTEAYHVLAEAVVQDHVQLLHGARTLPQRRPATRKALLQGVARAKAIMDARFHEALPVRMLAQEVAMSEYHFFRAFRSVMGQSPHQYLMGCRLQHARQRLLIGGTTVLDVALSTGFPDAPSFSKAFRRAFGHPPSGLLR